MKKPSVAFVVQRYGNEITGGAEIHCRLIVERMSPLWDIEVLTTCARDYVKRFNNDYPPGQVDVNGITARRFEIDYLRSDDRTFSELDKKVLKRQSNHKEDMLWLKEVGPYSSKLISYVRRNRGAYDLFVFFGYLYASTTLVLPLVREKACLVPTSHNEPPIYARFYDDFFKLPRMLIVSTEEELSFLRKRTSGNMAPAIRVGVGIEAPENVTGDLFRERFPMYDDFILYVGRIQQEKGCDDLFRLYSALPLRLRDRYPLVLIGDRAMDIPKSEHIISLGFVSEEMKYSAMSAATLLIMPSRYESLNMVILESWLSGTPVLVNGHCDVLREHCRRSNGGLWYTNFDEFEKCLEILTSNRTLSIQLARNGKRYTKEEYNWDRITDCYVSILKTVVNDASVQCVFPEGNC